MGEFLYGTPPIAVTFDDRELAHLQVVMLAKFRRGESFVFSWGYEVASVNGNSSVWLNPAIPFQFVSSGLRGGRLNKAWLEALIKLANSPSGLRLEPEPTEVIDASTG